MHWHWTGAWGARRGVGHTNSQSNLPLKHADILPPFPHHSPAFSLYPHLMGVRSATCTRQCLSLGETSRKESTCPACHHKILRTGPCVQRGHSILGRPQGSAYRHRIASGHATLGPLRSIDIRRAVNHGLYNDGNRLVFLCGRWISDSMRKSWVPPAGEPSSAPSVHEA